MSEAKRRIEIRTGDVDIQEANLEFFDSQCLT